MLALVGSVSTTILILIVLSDPVKWRRRHSNSKETLHGSDTEFLKQEGACWIGRRAFDANRPSRRLRLYLYPTTEHTIGLSNPRPGAFPHWLSPLYPDPIYPPRKLRKRSFKAYVASRLLVSTRYFSLTSFIKVTTQFFLWLNK